MKLSTIIKKISPFIVSGLALTFVGCVSAPVSGSRAMARQHGMAQIDPDDFPGISRTTRRCILQTNLMYEAAYKSIILAQDGQCERALGTLKKATDTVKLNGIVGLPDVPEGDPLREVITDMSISYGNWVSQVGRVCGLN